MKKIGVFYGSTTGTTEAVANKIATALEIPGTEVHDVSKLTAYLANSYDVLVLGTSTWGDGEVQDDWYDGIKTLKSINLSNKTIALFGCGDSESYPDTFCDGMGVIYEDLKDSGCQFIGKTSTNGYTFDSSISAINGQFVGLAIDDVNENDQTDSRISAWADLLKSDLT